MYELVEANWLLILIAFLIGVAIAWYVFNVRRRTRVTADRRDVLDEGAARARRNQAFLDAPTQPVDKLADLGPKIGDGPISVRPAADPPGMASLPIPGAIAGGETIANLIAGTPAVIGTAEQDEAAAAMSHDSQEIAAAAPTADPDAIGVAPVVAPAVPAQKDELTRLKGIGPKLAAQLHELGVTRFDQIAVWDDEAIERIDRQLGRFQGRIRRDDWVTQARLLSEGDEAGYQARFGRL